MILYHFILGTVIGSFLNVCIDRLPYEKSICYPRSHCDHCGHALGILELIPILSYINLKGRCKHCKSHISKRSLVVELITGFMFAFVYKQCQNSLQVVLFDLFISSTIALTVIDIEHMILPICLIKWSLIGGLLLKGMQAIQSHNWLDFNLSLIGGLIGYISFMLIQRLGYFLFKKECLGGGDIYLMSMIGFYIRIEYLYLSLMIASFLALIYGLILYIKYKKSIGYPFGPFLNLGAYSVLFFGEPLMLYFMQHITL